MIYRKNQHSFLGYSTKKLTNKHIFGSLVISLLGIYTSLAYSQTLSITGGLVLRLDANDVSTLTTGAGNTISERRDKSGSGNHASQGSSGQQPVRIQDSILGLGVTKFDGIDDTLTNSSLTGIGLTSIFVVASVQPGADTSALPRIIRIGTQTTTDIMVGISNSNAVPRAGVRIAGTNYFISLTSPNVGFTYNLFAYSRASTGLQQLWMNGTGTAKTNTSDTSGLTTVNNYAIGRQSTAYISGFINEIIVYSRVVSTNEQQSIQEYLNNKRILYGSESLLTGQATGNYQSGQYITYTLQYATRGPDNVSGIISMQLADSMTGISSNPNRSSISGNIITRSGVSILTGSTGSIILTAQVISGGSNAYIVTGSLTGSYVDSSSSNNTFIISGQNLYPSTDLLVTLTGSTGVIRGGEYIRYTLQYLNSGNDSINNVIIQSTLLSGVLYSTSSIIPTNSGVNGFGDKTLYRTIGSLGANATGTIIITGQVIQPFRSDPITSGLRLWYDPSTGLTYSGSTIVQRSNKVANTGHLIQSGIGLAPVLSGSSINGKPTVYFSGTSFLTGFQVIQPGMIGVVFMPSIIVGQKSYASVLSLRPSPICFPSLGANHAYALNYDPTLMFRHTLANGSLVQAWINGNSSSAQAHSNIVRFDAIVASFTGTINTGRSIALGKDFCAGYSEDRRFQGYIADVLIYEGFDQATSKMASLNRYLTWKYFIPGSSTSTPQLITSTSISGDNTELNTYDNTSNIVTEYQASANLGIQSSTNTSSYNPGTTIVWTINYYNSGRDAAAGISIVHQRQTGISFVTSSLSGVSSTTGIIFTNIQAEKNQTGFIIITGLLNTGLTITGISWTGTISSPLEDSVSNNNTSTGRITVNTTDLSISKSASGSAISGGILTYILSYANNSAYIVSGVNIIDTLSAGLSGLSTSIVPSNYANNTYTRTFGSLGAYQTGQIILTAQVITGTVGTNLSNTASIGSTIRGDNNTTNNMSSVASILDGPIDLLITLTASTGLVYGGDLFSYTIRFSNSGGINATHPVITGVLMSGLSLISWTGAGVSPLFLKTGYTTSGDLNLIRSGFTLTPGQSGTIVFTAQALNRPTITNNFVAEPFKNTNLILRVDAADTQTIITSGSSNFVSGVINKVNTAELVVQDNTSTRATTNQQTINGRNVFSMSNDTALGTYTNTTLDDNNMLSIFLMFAQSPSGHNNLMLNSNTNRGLRRNANLSLIPSTVVGFETFGQGSLDVSLGSGYGFNVATLGTYLINGITDTVQLRGNKTVSGSIASTRNIGTSLAIGGGFSGGNTNTRFRGKLAEVLVYNNILSNEQQNINEYYMMCKWGVSSYTNCINMQTVIGADQSDTDYDSNATSIMIGYQNQSQLSISGSHSASGITRGNTKTITLSYFNSGWENTSGLLMSFQRQSGLEFVSSSLSGSLSGSTRYIWTGLSLNKNQTGQHTITIMLTTGTLSGLYYRTGTISSNLSDSISANNTTTGIINVFNTYPDLRISQTTSGSPFYGGKSIVYTIDYGNSGQQIATGVLISDLLTGIQNISSSPTASRSGNNNRERDVITLTPGQTGRIIITGTISNGLVSGSTISNTAIIRQDGGLKFDGVNNYITTTLGIPTITADSGLSFSFYMSILSRNTANDVFFSNRQSGQQGYNLTARNYGGSTKIDLAKVSYANGIEVAGAATDNPIVFGRKYHFVFTTAGRNTNQQQVYVDGVLNSGDRSNFNTLSAGANTTSNQNFYIGVHAPVAFPSNIIIYDAKVFNKVLDSGEVSQLYQSQSVSIPTTASGNVLSDRRFNDISGTILSDRGPNNVSGNLISYTTPDTTLGTGNKRVDILGNPLRDVAWYESYINNNTSVGSISITASQDLSINKSANTGSAQAGDQIWYTIVFSGRGPDTGNVIIADYLSPGLRYLTSSLVPTNSGLSSTGSWFSFDGGSIGSGQSGSLTLTAIVLSGVSQALVNTATISSDILDPVMGNNTSSVTTSGLTTDLIITSITSTGSVYGGDIVGYQIQYMNSGVITARQVTIVATLFSGIILQSSDPNLTLSGLNSSGDMIIYRSVGDLSPGQTGSIMITGQILRQFSSGINTYVTITGNVIETTVTNNSGTLFQNYIDNADLNISVQYTGFSSGSIKINRYIINVGNSGREDNGLFDLSFLRASGFSAYQTSGGGLSGTNEYLWTGLSLAKDASLQRTIDIIKSGSLFTSLLYWTGSTTSPQVDANMTNNMITGLNYDIYAGTGDLSVIKTASTGAVYLGDIFSYTIQYTNSGDTLFGVSVTDTLVAGLQLISTSPALTSTGLDGSGNTIVIWSGLTILGNNSGTIVLTAQVVSWFPPILPQSGLQLWIDADDPSSITLSGGKVSQINDKSGKGRHATQTSGTRMPFYVSSGSREYMSFSGVQRVINTAFTGVHTKTGATKILHIIRGNQTTLCGGTCPNMNAFGIGNLNLTTQFFAGGYFDRINGTQYSIAAANMPATNNYIITTTYRGAAGISIRINSTLLFNNASAVNPINGIGYEIGAYYGRATANNLRQGQVGEVIVYDRALSTGEITDAENYLTYKRKNGQIFIGRGIINTVNISGSYDPNTGNNNGSILINYLPSSSVSVSGTNAIITQATAGQIISHTLYRHNQGPDESGPMTLDLARSSGYIFGSASITGVTNATGGRRSISTLASGQYGSFTITGIIATGINPEQISSILLTGFLVPSIIDLDTTNNLFTGLMNLAPSTIFIKTQIQNRAGGDQTTTGRIGIYSGTTLITGGEIALNSAGISQIARSLSGIFTVIIEGGSTLAIAKEGVNLNPGYINVDFTTGNIAGGFLISEFYGYFARDGDIIKGDNTRQGRNYINSLDLESLLNQFTPGTNFDPRYDLNKDNKINSSDITILIGNYYETGYGRPLEYDF